MTNDFYIGSSKCIPTRLNAHFSDAIHKPNLSNKLYYDIIKYGKCNFEWKVLEECSHGKLRDLESHYFEKLKPTYNMMHPRKNAVSIDEELRERLIKLNKERDSIPIQAWCEGVLVKEFNSVSEASLWINGNYAKSDNSKTSNICKALKGKINTYYGFNWRYSKV